MRKDQIVMAVPSSRITWAILFLCIEIAFMVLPTTAEEPAKVEEETLQMDNEMNKRDWNQKLQMWGKRGWNNLHGGWGLKRSVPSTWSDMPIAEKRGWDSLQGGWGKRFAPYTDEAAVQEIASYLENGNDHNLPDNSDLFDLHEEEKRNWAKFNGGWGKRSNWNNFRGSWGKRDPAWNNLKGYWGKRSNDQDLN